MIQGVSTRLYILPCKTPLPLSETPRFSEYSTTSIFFWCRYPFVPFHQYRCCRQLLGQVAHRFEVLVLYCRKFFYHLIRRSAFGVVLRSLLKGQLSDYSYRGEELTGFDFLDSLVDSSEIDVAGNKCSGIRENRSQLHALKNAWNRLHSLRKRFQALPWLTVGAG